MSVLIDMDMPKVCNECPFCCNPSYFAYAWCELLQQHFDMDESYNKVADFCPITKVPTPHGRLIDADFEEQHYTSMITNPTPDVTEQDKRNSLVIIEALQMAKTIIEAEGTE